MFQNVNRQLPQLSLIKIRQESSPRKNRFSCRVKYFKVAHNCREKGGKWNKKKKKISEISLPTGCPTYDVHPCRHWHRLCASFSLFFCSFEWKWRSMGTTYCSLLLHCHAEGERMTARWPDVGQDISRWIGNSATAIRYTVCNDWLFLRI